MKISSRERIFLCDGNAGMDKKQLLSLLTPFANASVPVRIMKYFDGFYFLVGTFSLENGVSYDKGCF